ncbi:hypothetical protein GCM10025864_18540 [Luteimicrobium album]|uniref:Schlafen AlbA-2 domain-containing protein n=1 Tax=Luteimicrobium album TaxID=1054550 RepID=A0ABQ6I0D0_9MICO|nr:hypothetical protein GCM10025864_18540 [Luteimicrobium album]
MKLDPLGDALQRIADGAEARSVETETLDFKRDPHTVTGRGAPGNPRARLVEELVDAVVCFANGRGGRIVLGVDDRTPGAAAFLGTNEDPTFLRNRIYGNTRPALTVPIEEIEYLGVRLLVWSPSPRRSISSLTARARPWLGPEPPVLHSQKMLVALSPTIGGTPTSLLDLRIARSVRSPRRHSKRRGGYSAGSWTSGARWRTSMT